MKKELPIVNIAGDEFLFDIENIVLIDKTDRGNEISFDMMTDHGSHYSFEYSKTVRNHSFVKSIGSIDDLFAERLITEPTVWVMVPRIAVIDPEGMCRKYNCTLNDIAFKSDFEILVDQEVYNMRMRGAPVTIDLAGKKYEVDVQNNSLNEWKGEKKIFLNDFHYDYYLEDEQAYHLFYDQKEHQIIDVRYEKKNENMVILEVPDLYLLDPMGRNFLKGTNPRFGLLYADLKLNHNAKNVPLSLYNLGVKKQTKPLFDQQLNKQLGNKIKRRSKGL